MARDITTALRDAFLASNVRPFLLFEAEFDADPLYAWSGIGTLTIDGTDYVGTGKFLRAELGEETTDIEARPATVALSGVAQDDIQVALAEEYSGRRARILLGGFDADWAVISDPVPVFSGLMSTMAISGDTVSPTIVMTADGFMIRLQDANERRYTHEDQQIDHAGDMFFSLLNDQDKKILWG